MLYTYSTEELIGLQDLIIEKIESKEESEINARGNPQQGQSNPVKSVIGH